MLLLVTGDRNWTDTDVIRAVLFRRYDNGFRRLVHGDCKGLDQLAGAIAERIGFTVIAMPANWKEHHRAAGPIRNQAMLDLDPDAADAFHDNIDNSRGTANMIAKLEKKGVPYELHMSHILRIQLDQETEGEWDRSQ